MNKFCTDCGSKIDFPANKPPKFCSSCGTPLQGSSKQTKDETDQIEEVQAKIPKNFKLAYEVSYAEGPRSMADIIKEEKIGIGKIPRKQTEESPLERAMNECRPTRESTDVG